MQLHTIFCNNANYEYVEIRYQNYDKIIDSKGITQEWISECKILVLTPHPRCVERVKLHLIKFGTYTTFVYLWEKACSCGYKVKIWRLYKNKFPVNWADFKVATRSSRLHPVITSQGTLYYIHSHLMWPPYSSFDFFLLTFIFKKM